VAQGRAPNQETKMNELELQEIETVVQSALSHRGQTIEHIFGFAQDIVRLRNVCEKAVYGEGTEFSAICLKRLGLSQQRASDWLKIGRWEFGTVITVPNLPASVCTLALLTKLPDDVIAEACESGDINPEMTQAMAKNFVSLHTTKPETQKRYIATKKQAAKENPEIAEQLDKGEITPAAAIHTMQKLKAEAEVVEAEALRLALPKTTQAKLDRAIKLYNKQTLKSMQKEFVEELAKQLVVERAEDTRKNTAVREWANNIRAEYEDRARGITQRITNDEFKQIRACLHSDVERSKEQLNKAFCAFNKLESLFSQKSKRERPK
jgi:hypothetical protein